MGLARHQQAKCHSHRARWPERKWEPEFRLERVPIFYQQYPGEKIIPGNQILRVPVKGLTKQGMGGMGFVDIVFADIAFTSSLQRLVKPTWRLGQERIRTYHEKGARGRSSDTDVKTEKRTK